MIYRKPISEILVAQQQLEEKARLCEHLIIYSEYEEILSSISHENLKKNLNTSGKSIRSIGEAVVKILCKKHPELGEQITTVRKYLKSRAGLKCCGKALTSEKLKGRKYSEETLEKMRISAQKRFANIPRSENKFLRKNLFEWSSNVHRNHRGLCVLTGIRPEKSVAHHLFSKIYFKSIQFFPENGVVLDAKIHDKFHQWHGTLHLVTIDTFLHFIEKLIHDETFRIKMFSEAKPRQNYPTFQKTISSQISQNDTGSETMPYYGKARLFRLLDHMTELRKQLYQKLTPPEKSVALQIFSGEKIIGRGVSALNDKSFNSENS